MASWLCNATASTNSGKAGGIGAILGMNADELAALITAAASKQTTEKVSAPARSERCGAASSSSKSDGSKNSSSSSASARLNVNPATMSAQFGI